MHNHELGPKLPDNEPTPLLERLIDEQTERAAVRAALGETDKLSFGFKADLARTSAYLNNPNRVKEIRILVIIPDNELTDAGKNQINLSTFVRRYLDQSEWADYITAEDEKD